VIQPPSDARSPQIPAVASGEPLPEYVPLEVLVTVPRNASQSLDAQIARDYGLAVVDRRSLALTNERLLRLRTRPGRSVPSLAERIERDPRVSAAQPNYLYRSPSPNMAAAPEPLPTAPMTPGPQPPGPQNAPAPQGAPDQAGLPEQQPQDAPDVPDAPNASGQPPALPGPGGAVPENPNTPPPALAAQYGLTKVNAVSAHALARGEGVLVAVIDSGVDRVHPDLKDAVASHFDVFGDQEDAFDTHGTAVAGIIGGRGLVRGVAPRARLLDVRAFKAGVRGGPKLATTFVLASGLEWAVGQTARILNLSFEGPRDPQLGRIIRSAAKRGAIMVAAAGNGGADAQPAYPAAYEEVIAVTATDPADKLYGKANRGSYIAIAAPGVDIFAPIPGKAHGMHSGTSFAAAHVSGIIALLLQRVPDLNAREVLDVLLYGARDLGPPGRDPSFGAGEADAVRALGRLESVLAARR